MFLKQTTYKPRSNSQSSQGSGKAEAGAEISPSQPKERNKDNAANNSGPVSAAAAGRRRSSASGGAFAGLNSHKRNSQDQDAAARKASWAEQKPGQGGILSGMWNNFTKGS